MSDSIKLNLQYVADKIKDDYKNWKNGDIVKIKTQTGTGKTYFIKNVLIPYIDEINSLKIYDSDLKVLILTNRVNLSRQIKRDLYNKYNLKIPKKVEELDKHKNIENITIMSYQNLNELVLNKSDYKIDYYDYIVADEIQYILDDSWTGTTETILDYLMSSKHSQSIKIFISATMEQLDNIIDKADKNNEYEYDTNRDYSYLKPYIYSKQGQLISQIVNDKTNNKWIIFVASIQKGRELLKELKNNNIDVTMIYRGCKNKKAKEELNNIVINEKFNSKVLITTKLLDNGINILDDKVKNIVINSWDKINLIQSIGRVRFKDIKKAYKINLYLDIKTNKQFSAKIQSIDNHLRYFELLKSDKEAFNKKYRNKINTLPNGIHLDENNNFIFDKVTYGNLKKSKLYLEKIKDNFNSNTYTDMQLNYLGIKQKPINLNTMEHKQIADKLKEYIESLIDNTLNKEQQKELIETIGLKDNRNRLQKSYGIINQYLEKNYNVTIEKSRIRQNGKQITIWKIKNK